MATKLENENELDSESVVERAKKRFELAQDYWHDIYKAAEDDQKFKTGDQWPSNIKKLRDEEGKPSLTINKTNPAVRQVTNDQRQNRPSIKVSAVDDLADVETAKIRQGIIRHIEYSSGADAAYDTGFEQAATGGLGFWRIVTDYCDPLSFDQDIIIKRVPRFQSILLDPSFQEPDASDALFGFVETKIPRSKFKAEFPEAELAKDDEWGLQAEDGSGWVEKEECRVIEYYEKTFEEKELLLLSDGNALLKEEYDELLASLGSLPPGVDVVQSRKALVPKIKWYRIAGKESLEETDIPGEHIPIVPVLGDEYYIDGKRVLEGIVRHAKDSQRMYNYMASTEAETIALAPRAPFIGVEGQFEGYENQWATANVKSHAFLQYKNVDLNGQMAPPPQRNVYEPPVQAITQARMLASDDLKATTGIYDAALGAKSNETSGIAIQRRNQQAQTSNFHLIDNLTRSIRHTGRIINSWIPVYYDGPRVARIIGEEGDEEIVKLNQEFQHKGEMKTFRLDVGKYDVAVETGPSFATKRQEAAAAMLDLTKAYPNLFPIIGDLMVKSLDIPGAQEMGERLKRVAPPGVIEDKNQKPIPPEVQAKMQQMDQMVQQLTEALTKSQEEMAQKTRELESRERIETMKLENQATIELAKLQSQEAQALLAHQVRELDQRVKILSQRDLFQMKNEAAPGGPMPASEPMNQPPTGGPSPGTYMGV